MDSQTQQKIKETVLEILKDADMQETTEFEVRSMASEKLGLDLSAPELKRFVRHVVENFLQSKKEDEANQNQEEDAEKEEEEEVQEEEKGKKKKTGEKEYDDEGDLIICRLSNKRRVTLQEFRGKTLVSIREYYEKDGKQLPSSKGFESEVVKEILITWVELGFAPNAQLESGLDFTPIILKEINRTRFISKTQFH